MEVYHEKTDQFSYDRIDYCFDPVQCIDFLQGIVTNDVLVEFDADPEEVRETFGVYADPIGGYDSLIDISEYCTISYNRDQFVPLRYALVEDRNHYRWYDFR